MDNDDLQKLCVSRISNMEEDSGLHVIALAILRVIRRLDDVTEELCRIANQIERDGED
jgi:hypothetical protein